MAAALGAIAVPSAFALVAYIAKAGTAAIPDAAMLTLSVTKSGVSSSAPLANGFTASHPALLACFGSLFLGIVFMQSGLDKWLDFPGNLGYFRSVAAAGHQVGMEHMAVPGLLLVSILETLAGVFSLAGAIRIVFFNDPSAGLYGVLFSLCALAVLMFGQRMAKDYAGAGGLVPYMLLAMATYAAYTR